MSADQVDLAEAILAADDPATLYADLVDDWESAYGDINHLASRMRDISEGLAGEDQEQLRSHFKGQSDGLFMALRVMRERRPEPSLDES